VEMIINKKSVKLTHVGVNSVSMIVRDENIDPARSMTLLFSKTEALAFATAVKESVNK